MEEFFVLHYVFPDNLFFLREAKLIFKFMHIHLAYNGLLFGQQVEHFIQ